MYIAGVSQSVNHALKPIKMRVLHAVKYKSRVISICL